MEFGVVDAGERPVIPGRGAPIADVNPGVRTRFLRDERGMYEQQSSGQPSNPRTLGKISMGSLVAAYHTHPPSTLFGKTAIGGLNGLPKHSERSAKSGALAILISLSVQGPCRCAPVLRMDQDGSVFCGSITVMKWAASGRHRICCFVTNSKHPSRPSNDCVLAMQCE